MKVPLADIENAAKRKGSDYRRECLESGKLIGDTVEMDTSEWNRIATKYPETIKLGDMVHSIAGPIGEVLHWPCMKGDGTTDLKPGSPCDQARTFLNGLTEKG